eukprot:TRINITY_DN20489_c0_g1_i1.p1 TRINITY_DN20489_c0_g1~~TRINITY_DN20489_c0_g1_i1.p1  ORF type:complete len:212 (+),score=39.51 TRINITY_DN20489_c0_g1_i1:46-681(+)
MSQEGGFFNFTVFGRPKVNAQQRVRQWQREIRKQDRVLERQRRDITREENKVILEIKQASKKNDITNCKILAKEIVRSKKAKERIYTSKARLNSISMQLNEQLATLKVAGCLQKSTEVMQLMNRLVNLPQISATMRAMAREMEQTGLIEEMTDEVLGGLDDDDIEEEAETEVNKILDSILGNMPLATGADLKVEEDEELSQRITKLKSASA